MHSNTRLGAAGKGVWGANQCLRAVFSLSEMHHCWPAISSFGSVRPSESESWTANTGSQCSPPCSQASLTQTHPPEPYDPHDTHIAVLNTHTQTHSTHQPHTTRPHVALSLAVFHQSSARLCSTYSRPTHHCRLQRSAGWDVSDTPSEPPPPPSTRPGRIAAPKN